MAASAFALVAIAIPVGLYVVARDDGGSAGSGSGASATLVDPALLDDAGRELVALVERGRTFTYHAVYEGGSEVWVDGPGGRLREDAVTDDGVHHRLLRTSDEALDCQEREPDGKWTCEPTDALAAGVEARLGEFVGEVAGATVTASSDTAADLAVRCFAIASGEEPVTICLTGDGVVARLAAGDATLELRSLDTHVPGSVFDDPR